PTLGDWPGTPMTKIGDNGMGSDNYQITVPANTAYIIFTDGQNQTVDIPCQTGKGYYPTNQTNGKWNVGTWDLGDTPEPPVVETTTQVITQPPVATNKVQFTNNQHWNTVYAYAWTSSEQPTLGQWPGTAMTKLGDNGMGSDNYEITVPANTAYIIFTDGQNQTVDIPCQTGKGYYPTTQTNGKWNVDTWDLEVQPGTEQTTTDQGQVELTDPEITEQTTTPVASEIYDPSRTVRTYSISLADAIGMTFRVLTNTVADLDNPYVVVEMNGQKTVIDTYTEDTSRGEYLFKFNKIYPQNLGDEVTATVYGMKNGVLYYGPEYTKTVKGYVENQLAKPAVTGNVPMRKLLVSLLNYGAETQLYSGYHTDNLATSGLTNEQKSWGETEYGTLVNVKNYNYETYPGTTCTWKSASLVLGSTVQIKTRFTASDASSKKIRVEINGAYEDFGPENIVDEGNGTYSFSYAGVYANSMNENVKFTVMEQGKPVSSTTTYSIASYASNYINSSQYPALASLLRAMMCYGKAAESFG
ncbi:MAG: starch-binding protein, partial [Ruminococcus sp.]|nr:starch-binding protein [Ruminococcus sp.]